MKKSIITFACLAFAGCSNSSTQITPTVKSTEEFTLQSETFSPKLNLTGNIEANKSIPITAKIPGRIDNLHVEIGDRVYKGQVLARYSAQNNENQISYQNAINQLESTKQTTENNTITAEIQYKNTELTLKQNLNEKESQRQKQYSNLLTLTKNSDLPLSNTIDFLDQSLAVSQKYKIANINASQIASNNYVEKNALKNEIADFSQNTNNSPTPNKKLSNKQITESAKNQLKSLQRAQNNLQIFTDLLRNTPTTSQFTNATKSNFVTQTNTLSQTLATQTMNLENMIEATQVLEEQINLSRVSNESALKNTAAQLELAKSAAKSQITNAQNNLNMASSFQNEMTIIAPFAGVITQKLIDHGQLVTPGQKMFQIADDSVYKIKTEIADKNIADIKNGTPTTIIIDGYDKILNGQITKINPAVNPQTRKIGIEITLNQQTEIPIKIGQFANIEIALPNENAFFVPKKFITFDFDGAKVFVEDKGWVKVETGAEKNQNIEIKFSDINENLVLIRQK